MHQIQLKKAGMEDGDEGEGVTRVKESLGRNR